MLRNTLCRSFILVLVVLAFALTPTVAQATPRTADDTSPAWDLAGALHQLWDILWGSDERGPTIDPGLRAQAAPRSSRAVQPAPGQQAVAPARATRGRG